MGGVKQDHHRKLSCLWTISSRLFTAVRLSPNRFFFFLSLFDKGFHTSQAALNLLCGRKLPWTSDPLFSTSDCWGLQVCSTTPGSLQHIFFWLNYSVSLDGLTQAHISYISFTVLKHSKTINLTAYPLVTYFLQQNPTSFHSYLKQLLPMRGQMFKHTRMWETFHVQISIATWGVPMACVLCVYVGGYRCGMGVCAQQSRAVFLAMKSRVEDIGVLLGNHTGWPPNVKWWRDGDLRRQCSSDLLGEKTDMSSLPGSSEWIPTDSSNSNWEKPQNHTHAQ